MNNLFLGLIGAVLATNQPQAVSNLVQQQTGVSVEVAATPEEKELRNIMIADDATMEEINQWISTNTIASTNAPALADFNRRIRARLDVQRKSYEDFLHRHPNSAEGYLAYGSFLNDIGQEDEAKNEYENSRQLDPKNPAVWNNLANYYGEYGELTNAFIYYTEAIRLDPTEPVYYQNFATTVYLYRKDAREFYNINEQQVFDKALGLYRQAMKLAPQDFKLATDYAESYYGIKPLRTNDALVAWTNALNVAHTDAERQGVDIHLARVKISAGFFDEASNQLAAVTNTIYADLKKRLERSLHDHEFPSTNAVEEISATTSPNAESNQPVTAIKVISPTTNNIVSETNLLDLSTNLEVAPPTLQTPPQ